MELFYFNAMQDAWIRVPHEVRDFMNTIPQIQVLRMGERVVSLKLLKEPMRQEDVDKLPKVVR